MKIRTVFLLFVMVLLCGCGEEKQDNTISISDSYQINEITVKDEPEGFSPKEEKERIETELSDYYVSTHGNSIELNEISVSGGTVITELTYGKYEIYNNYTGRNLYAGSIHGALEIEDNTYFYNVVFLDTKTGKQKKTVDVIANTSDKAVIFDSPDYIYHVNGKIRYISENVELIDKKNARLKEGESGLGYIIYK